MEPVKITDTKEWSSIDIFLFSNGQQYSPPRKYHLRSEELQWWGATMSYLGRTHYGAGHSSIQLYAINGTKINGPLDLVNGAAYVAVEPPDSFVNTGYEEYLVRATRSWEKRLAQKSYNTEVSNLDLEGEQDSEVQRNADSMNTSALENTANVQPMKIGSNSITSPQKSRPTKPHQRLQRKSITSPKQIQKKKSIDTQGAIIKKLCAEKDKLIPCPNKPSLRKNGFVNQKPSLIVSSKPNERFNQEPFACCKKRGAIKSDSNPKPEALKSLNGCNTAPISEPQAIDLYTNNEIESMSLKNEPEPYANGDPSMNHNGQNNLKEENSTRLDELPHKDKTYNKQDYKMDSSNKLKQTNEYENSDLPLKNDNLKTEMGSDRQDEIPMINKTKENKIHDTLLNNKSDKEVSDEYIAHMNKGGLLLLKLKVKLKGCKTILNKDKLKSIPMATSLHNMPETEKTSQADINISFSGELLKSNNQQHRQDKSLQSLINKLYSEETDHTSTKKPRIIILQCACRNYSDNYKCMCDKFDGYEGDSFEETLNQNLNENFTRCDCHTDSLRTSKDEYGLANGTRISPVKKLESNRISFSNGTRVKDLAQKFEMSDGKISNDKNNNNIQNSNNRSLNGNQRQSLVLARIFDSRLEESTENQSGEDNNDSNSIRVCNKSTQTDWCSVLLEARLHEDDKYSFHLPPLYLLKECNL